MAFVYLTRQGASVRRRGRSLIVEVDGKQESELEVHRIDALCIFGRAHLTTPAVELLLRNGVETAFLTKAGRLKGQLTPARPRNITLRLAQFQRFLDVQERLAMSRKIVGAKLGNALGVLKRFASNHPGALPAEAMGAVADACLRAGTIGDLAGLRGVEGAGSRAYFQAFRSMNLSELAFDGRSSRPPRDPVNALLSFGYVLLGNEIQHLLDAVGLDPYLGFYHEPVDRRASLAVDLIEELRHPLIDRFVLTQVNRKVFSLADFRGCGDRPSAAGVRLSPIALNRFLASYDEWMNRPGRGDAKAPRRIVRRQIELLADWLRNDQDYQPYLFEA